MGIERKLGRDERFKKQKLEKTRGRRQRLDDERRLAECAARAGRNDLLPRIEVREVAIAALRPARRQVRKVDPAQVERLTRAIAQFGFTVPILIRGAEIIDGHARIAAAEALGLERVSAIDCSHLGEGEARTLRIAVNRLAEKGAWDIDELRIEMGELIDLEIDLDVTGFTLEEQDIILLDPLGEDETGESECEPAPPPEVPVSRLGDRWVLGEHVIVCGNSLEAETYEALLGDQKVEVVLTDPPYNVPIKGNVSGLGKKVHDEFVMASGELDASQWQDFLDTLMVRMGENSATGAVIFAFMDWRSIHRLIEAALSAGLTYANLVVWYKQSGGMGGFYRSAHELVGVFCNGERPATNNIVLGAHGRDRTNVWSVPGANRRGSSAGAMLAKHATPKPVELCVDALLDVSRRGDLVLDAFLGSGTTLIAAEKCGRVCRAIELDPRFVDVAILRWEELTGEEAVHAASGETFAVVAEHRRTEAAAARADQSDDEGGEAQ